MKNQITRTPYLVLFIILISIGVGTASAGILFPTITLDGDVIITDNLDVAGSTSSQTITNLDSRLSILEGGN